MTDSLLYGITLENPYCEECHQMKKAILICLTVFCLFHITGCSATSVPVVGNLTSTPTPKPTATPSPTETPIAIITSSPQSEPVTPLPVSLTPIAEADAHLNIIGEKEEGDDVFRIKLVNSTGSALIGFTVIPETAKEMPENLLSRKDPFVDKEERILYYKKARKKSEIRYDLEVVFEDKSYYRMTDVPLADMKEGVIYHNDQVVYIVYISKKTGDQISTKEQELAAHHTVQDENQYDDEDRYDDEDQDYEEDQYYDEDEYNYEDQSYDDQEYDDEYREEEEYNNDYDEEYDD